MNRTSAAALSVSIALAGAASARQLPTLDAHGKSPTKNHRDLTQEERALLQPGRPIHWEERRGVPTFLWTAPSTPEERKARQERRTPAPEVAKQGAAKLASLWGLTPRDIAAANVAHVHDTGQGAIIVKLKEDVAGVEVFREEMSVLMDRTLEPLAVSGYLGGAPRRLAGKPARFEIDEKSAVATAFQDRTGEAVSPGDLVDTGERQGPYRFIAEGPRQGAHGSTHLGEPARLKSVYFHLGDEFVPAYYVELAAEVPRTEPAGRVLSIDIAASGAPANPYGVDNDLYAYVVSAADGTILFRHDLTENDSYTYKVWADTSGLLQPNDSPLGNAYTPHPTGNDDSTSATPVAQITQAALQNIPFSHNDPWLPAAATVTTGNNVDAYVDLASPDGFSAGDFRADVTSPGIFSYTYDTTRPPWYFTTTNNTTNQTIQRKAGIVQLFYDNNFLHDYYYDAGFDEAAGNAQTDNFGRGGLGGDSIKAEGQDYSGFDNANMSTPADGGRPRMQMYVFNGRTSIKVNSQTGTNLPGTLSGIGFQSGAQPFSGTANVVVATDGAGTTTDACSALTNGASVSGKFALVDYTGSCSIGTMVANVAAAGAVGMLFNSNVGTSPDGTYFVGGEVDTTMSLVAISLNQANAFKAALGLGAVNVTVDRGVDPDGTVDDQVIEHEWGHYLSNRLIGNGSGLVNPQGRGMGEGWSDFNAQLLTVRSTDTGVGSNSTWNGVYTTGAYAAVGLSSNSLYFGIRRVPYSTNQSKDPLTFKHTADGNAISPPFVGPCDFGCDGSSNSEVHNTGEVWATMLWEAFASLLRDTQGGSPRLTFDQARDRMHRYLVASLKMTPVAPTILEARDALLAAAYANDATDGAEFCAAFATRGAGQRAVAADRYALDNGPVTESFSCTADLSFVSATLTPLLNCDGDQHVDNNESWTLAVTLRNDGNTALSHTTALVTSGNAAVYLGGGGAKSFPSTNPFQTTAASIPVSLTSAAGVQDLSFDIAFTDSAISAMPTTLHATFYAEHGNTDEQANASASDSVETVQTPFTTTGSGATWTRMHVSASNTVWHVSDPGVPADVRLVTPVLNVSGMGDLGFTFKQRFAFDADAGGNYDGGVIEISTDGGSTWTDVGGGAIAPSYGGVLTVYSGNPNPLQGRSAFVGQSSGYPGFVTTTVSLGSGFHGASVQVRFRMGTDFVGGAAGWDLDDFSFTGITNTPFPMLVAQAGSCGQRGDANGSGGRDVADIFYLVNALFAGGPAPVSQCGGDVNKNGSIDVADVFFLINFLFAGGPAPAAC